MNSSGHGLTRQSSECSNKNTNKLSPTDDSAGTTTEGEAAKDTEMETSSASAFESSTRSSSSSGNSGKEVDAFVSGGGGGSRVLLEGTSDVLDRSLHTISDEETMDTSGKENNVNAEVASIPTHMDVDDNTRGDEKFGEEKSKNGSSRSGKSMNYEHSGSNLNKGSNSERSLGSNTKSSVPKWSDVLVTPSDNAAYTPSTDVSNMKDNLHGVGLRHAVDRAKLLARTGRGCANLLDDVSSLHEELSQSIFKLCPSTLASASAGTPISEFANDVNACVSSFANQIQTLGDSIRNDVARPCFDSSAALAEGAQNIYSKYAASRAACFQSRKDALKSRQKYVGSVKDANASIQSLRRAKKSRLRRRGSDLASEINATKASSLQESYPGRGEGAEVAWEDALKKYGLRHGLNRGCEAVIKALEEVQASESQYSAMVTLENGAVEEAQAMEKMALDSMQTLEEKRVINLLETFEMFLQTEKAALSAMGLTLQTKPLDLKSESASLIKQRELPIPTSNSSLFMSPRRRTHSEEGPAINDIRMLNLPDHLAEFRDKTKSMIRQQSTRLESLKIVFAFNEGIANALESFAVGLYARLDIDGYVGKSENKNNSNTLSSALREIEGPKTLNAWRCVIGSLQSYAKYADDLAKEIKRGNVELKIILVSAEKELKVFHDSEESRWKYLCDAAKGVTKAKVRQKQNLADLEKAKTRVSQAEGDGGPDQPVDETKVAASVNKSLGKMFAMMPGASNEAAGNKMTPSMNKAMGKMFSMMPGGGEDVMAKVLKPEQRLAIAKRNLDEAKAKELKATESFEVATSVNQQAIVTYETEAEAAQHKFKSDNSRAWNEMQNALECSVKAMASFRESHLMSLELLLGSLDFHNGSAMRSDVKDWTMRAEKFVKDFCARRISEMKERDSEFDVGFSLGLYLEDSTDVKELVSLVVADEDGIAIEDEETEQQASIEGEEIPEVTDILPDVPPDIVMSRMEPIFTKKLKNVSIEDYYTAGWADHAPYRPWLEKKGSFDLLVSDWDFSESGFENPWSNETFPQKRIVKFKFKRTTHLYIGPPVAGVTQTQYCLKDGNDKCVLMMTVEMDGIPYSDSFAVEVRWVARRIGNRDIVIDAGVFVRFMKSNMFANKIKNGALSETKPIHLDLFDVIKEAISSVKNDANGGIEVDSEEPDEELTSDSESIYFEGRKTNPDTVQQLKSVFEQVMNVVSQSPNSTRLGAAGVIFILLMLFLLRKNYIYDTDTQPYDDLANEVEQMSKEIREIKKMVEHIIVLLGESEIKDEL